MHRLVVIDAVRVQRFVILKCEVKLRSKFNFMSIMRVREYETELNSEPFAYVTWAMGLRSAITAQYALHDL